ncbi:hypothetical protein C122C_0093 [Leuconostoc gelidum subsp. gasicomitatum]|uniref:KAP NTPase domain-containing protein n=1 Tax=Leuconostoc gasicomitatum TaxID=115778 RepID=A0ABP2B6E0_9LACO|nr:P-loop NTPase fold protein [Leuconostoc gasicomitatum]CUW14756.1 hypothetical protein C122C_0093 [Leuconostoc gasicomitatum]
MHRFCKKNRQTPTNPYELQSINTKNDEENLQKLLGKKKTFFLNGIWGSGKSTFLENTAGKKYKVRILNLWELDSKYSVFSVAFKVVHPALYFIERLIIAILITLSVASLPLQQLNLFNKMPAPLILLIIFCTIFVSVVKLMEVKTNTFDKFFLKRKGWLLKRSLLVIDDFDRVESDRQESIYKLLNFLHGEMEIFILGEYRSLELDKNTFYLHKFIDKRVELPYALQPKNIWFNYFSDLGKKLNTQIPEALIKKFIEDDRNLRDRVQFNNLVIQEFRDNKKMGHVKVGQQLIIMYLYLYYFQSYEKLIFKPESQLNLDDQLLQEMIAYLLKDESASYPVAFSVNRSNYLIFEIPKSLTISEIENILISPDKLEDALLEKKFSDSFFQFVSFKYVLLPYEIRKKIVHVIFSVAIEKRNLPTKVASFIIITELQGHRSSEFIGSSLHQWRKLLESFGYHINEQIYFFRLFHIFSYSQIGNSYFPELLGQESFYDKWNTEKNSLYSEEFIISYLSFKNLWYKFDEWTEDIWTAISELSESQFKHFSAVQNIQSKDNHSDFTLAITTPGVEDIYDRQRNTKFLEKMHAKIEDYAIDVVDE